MQIHWSIVLPFVGAVAYVLRKQKCFDCSSLFGDMVPSEIVVPSDGDGSDENDSATTIELATVRTREYQRDWTANYVHME